MEVELSAVQVEVEAELDGFPIHEPMVVGQTSAALSTPSASIGGVLVLLLPLFDPVPCSTMTLKYSAQTAIYPFL